MRRRCSGEVVWFSMQPPGSEMRDFIDDHCRRGGKAVVLEPTDKGDMIVIRHGRRSMQLAWTHLLPSTFGGTAKMNVANAMAAAGAAFAAGAPLHDIRQGLRTFTTSYYLSPGRMNLLDVHHVDVVVDYCHNAPGMRTLGDFVEPTPPRRPARPTWASPRGSAMIAAAGDRRDDDMRELGTVAADHFDVDRRPRGPPAARPRTGRGRRAGRRGRPGQDGRGRAAAGRSRSSWTSWTPCGTAWPGPTPATWSSSASTTTPTVLAELEQLTHSAQAGAHEGTRRATRTWTPGRCRTRPRPRPQPRRRRPTAEPPPRTAAGPAVRSAAAT